MPRLYLSHPRTGATRAVMHRAKSVNVAYVRGYRGRPRAKGTTKSYRIFKSLSTRGGVEHQFIRSFNNNWGLNMGATGTNGLNFRSWTVTLNQLPGISELTQLYDYYTVDECRLKIHFSWNMAQIADKAGTAQPFALPVFYNVSDKDDDVLPGSIDELREYPNMKSRIARGTIVIKSKLYPKSIVAETDAATVTARLATDFNKKGHFLDMANANVQHFGLGKGCLDCSKITNVVGPVNFQDVNEEYEVHFRCKGIR